MIPAISFVCSHGRTGTVWITRALDSHPDIAAVHGPVSPLQRGQSLQTGWAAGDRFFSLSLEAMNAELQSFSTKTFKCRIHALNAFQLIEKVRSERPAFSIRAVNVIRHPIPRVESYHKAWQTQWNAFPSMQEFMTRFYLTNDLVKDVLVALTGSGFDPPESMDDKLFVCAVVWLNNDLRDFQTDIPIFPFERLVGDIEYWMAFLRAGFGPTIEIPFTHLRNVQNLPAANVETAERRSSAEIYAHWEPWKRLAFRYFSIKYDIPAAYKRFGYEFEM